MLNRAIMTRYYCAEAGGSGGAEPWERPVEPAPGPEGEDRRTARKRFSRMGVGIVLILLVSSAVQIALAAVLNAVVPGGVRNTSWGLWAITFAPLYLVGVPAGLLILRGIPADRPEKESMGAGRYIAIIFISIFMMYAGNTLGVLIQGLVEELVGFVPGNPLEDYVADGSLALKVLCMVILAPLIEEFIFRRSLIDRMRPYGEKLAVVTTALMFGLFHGNLSQMFYAFTLGLVFGYVYVRTGKLRYSVGLHMLINLVGGVLGPALTDWVDSSMGGLESWENFDPTHIGDLSALPDMSGLMSPAVVVTGLYTMVMLGGAVAGLVLLIVRAGRVTFRPMPLELPRGRRFSTVWLNPGMLLFLAVCLLLVASTFLM